MLIMKKIQKPKLKEYEIDLSYEDLIKHTTTITINAKNKKEALKEYSKRRDYYVNYKPNWEENCVGDGYDINIDEIRENRNVVEKKSQ